MSISFCSFASGSTGNCYMVKSDTTIILIDVGISGKKIFEALAQNDLDIENVNGVLITHEHSDHIKSVRIVSKKAENAKVYASRGTWKAIENLVSEPQKVVIENRDGFYIGDIFVKPFHLSHDAAEPIGYTLEKDNKRITIATDTGCITDEIFEQLYMADLIVIEANHEVNILRMGSYPYNTQQRILSDYGHLSNVTTGECLCKVLQEKDSETTLQVILAHMSRENNTPAQAYLTIKNILQENDFYIDKDLILDIITKDQISPLFSM
ncbi:MAG: MBL fold metallo-hydrolase [Anaerovoracaceae bacterium]